MVGVSFYVFWFLYFDMFCLASFDVNKVSSFQVFCRFGVIEDIYMAVDDMKVSRGMSIALHTSYIVL